MSLWPWVVMTVGLVACKNHECPAVRKEVARELKLAYEGVLLERDILADEAAKAAAVPAGYRSPTANLEERFRLLEQSMDCLVHKDDCCANLSKWSLDKREPIQSIALKVADAQGLPVEVSALLDPLRALTTNLDAIGTGDVDRKAITPWCTKVRDAVAQIRATAPAAWKTATDEANKRTAAAKAAVEAQDKLVDELAGWARALEKSESVAISDAHASKELALAREAIERYQNACH